MEARFLRSDLSAVAWKLSRNVPTMHGFYAFLRKASAGRTTFLNIFNQIASITYEFWVQCRLEVFGQSLRYKPSFSVILKEDVGNDGMQVFCALSGEGFRIFWHKLPDVYEIEFFGRSITWGNVLETIDWMTGLLHLLVHFFRIAFEAIIMITENRYTHLSIEISREKNLLFGQPFMNFEQLVLNIGERIVSRKIQNQEGLLNGAELAKIEIAISETRAWSVEFHIRIFHLEIQQQRPPEQLVLFSIFIERNTHDLCHSTGVWIPRILKASILADVHGDTQLLFQFQMALMICCCKHFLQVGEWNVDGVFFVPWWNCPIVKREMKRSIVERIYFFMVAENGLGKRLVQLLCLEIRQQVLCRRDAAGLFQTAHEEVVEMHVVEVAEAEQDFQLRFGFTAFVFAECFVRDIKFFCEFFLGKFGFLAKKSQVFAEIFLEDAEIIKIRFVFLVHGITLFRYGSTS